LVIEKIHRKSKGSLKLIKIKTQPTRTYETMAKAVLRGKLIAMSAYIKRTERPQKMT
jgi:hypothetical protein